MKVTLNSKPKIDTFVAIFQLLKNCSSVLKLDFLTDRLSIQGMDKSHVCLFYVIIQSTWFQSYETDKNVQIYLDSASLYTILSKYMENNCVVLTNNNTEDYMDIEMLSDNVKGEYNRYFQLPIIDVEEDSLDIPDTEFDADFSLKTKQLHDLTSQLILFGDTLDISCNENSIQLNTSSEHGKMTVKIPIDDLNEFSISEGEELQLSFSLNYVHKMCLTTKLSKDIQLSIKNDYPIRLTYDLGENSSAVFFVAPKVQT